MQPNRNPVARFSRQFNKATVQRDRKAAAKRGQEKHRRDFRREAA